MNSMTSNSIRFFIRHSLALLAILSLPAAVFAQGSLTPPGAPAPTMKTLAQIEPRVDVTTLPGNDYCLYLITNSGAYYLTTNVTGVAGKCAIRIEADHVTLDLGGFVLRGADLVFPGIQVTRVQQGITIQNGDLSGWGGGGVEVSKAAESRFVNLRIQNNQGSGFATGLQTGSNCVVMAVTVSGNDYFGIYAREYCRLSDCIVRSNRLDGIYVAHGSQVRDSQSCFNGSDGINAADGCVLESCVADANGYQGISTGIETTVARCTVSGNTNNGIYMAAGTVATSCAAQANGSEGFWGPGCVIIGCSAISNRNDGIGVSGSAVVRNCVARQNLRSGIYVNVGTGGIVAENECTANGSGGGDAGLNLQGSGCRAEGNNLTANNPYGINTSGSSCFIIRNSATGNTNNYNFLAGITYGPIQTGTGVITNLNPWANFSY